MSETTSWPAFASWYRPVGIVLKTNLLQLLFSPPVVNVYYWTTSKYFVSSDWVVKYWLFGDVSVVRYHVGLRWWVWRNKRKNLKSVQDQGTFCGEDDNCSAWPWKYCFVCKLTSNEYYFSSRNWYACQFLCMLSCCQPYVAEVLKIVWKFSSVLSIYISIAHPPMSLMRGIIYAWIIYAKIICKICLYC